MAPTHAVLLTEFTLHNVPFADDPLNRGSTVTRVRVAIENFPKSGSTADLSSHYPATLPWAPSAAVHQGADRVQLQFPGWYCIAPAVKLATGKDDKFTITLTIRGLDADDDVIFSASNVPLRFENVLASPMEQGTQGANPNTGCRSIRITARALLVDTDYWCLVHGLGASNCGVGQLRRGFPKTYSVLNNITEKTLDQLRAFDAQTRSAPMTQGVSAAASLRRFFETINQADTRLGPLLVLDEQLAEVVSRFSIVVQSDPAEFEAAKLEVLAAFSNASLVATREEYNQSEGGSLLEKALDSDHESVQEIAAESLSEWCQDARTSVTETLRDALPVLITVFDALSGDGLVGSVIKAIPFGGLLIAGVKMLLKAIIKRHQFLVLQGEVLEKVNWMLALLQQPSMLTFLIKNADSKRALARLGVTIDDCVIAIEKEKRDDLAEANASLTERFAQLHHVTSMVFMQEHHNNMSGANSQTVQEQGKVLEMLKGAMKDIERQRERQVKEFKDLADKTGASAAQLAASAEEINKALLAARSSNDATAAEVNKLHDDLQKVSAEQKQAMEKAEELHRLVKKLSSISDPLEGMQRAVAANHLVSYRTLILQFESLEQQDRQVIITDEREDYRNLRDLITSKLNRLSSGQQASPLPTSAPEANYGNIPLQYRFELGDLRVGRVLGGSVFEVEIRSRGGTNLRHHKVAGKFLAEWTPDAAIKEFEELLRFEHYSVVRPVGICIDPSTRKIVILTALASSSLADLLRQSKLQFDPKLTYALMLDVVEAVRWLHDGAQDATMALHLSLAPENILVVDRGHRGPSAKLSHMGSCRATTSGANAITRTSATVSAPQYAAPEQWSDDPSVRLSPATDVYTICVILWEILSNRKAWQGLNTVRIARALNSEKRQLDPVADLGLWPRDLIELVNRGINIDPRQRCTLDELSQCLMRYSLASNAAPPAMSIANFAAENPDSPLSNIGDITPLGGVPFSWPTGEQSPVYAPPSTLPFRPSPPPPPPPAPVWREFVKLTLPADATDSILEGFLQRFAAEHACVVDIVAPSPLLTNRAMELIVSFCPLLTTLDLCGATQIDDNGFDLIAASAFHLQCLSIEGNAKITDLTLRVIVQNCPELCSLNVGGTAKITDKSITAVAENCPKLESFNCCNTGGRITDAAITSLLLQCRGLRTLAVAGTNGKITDSCLLLAGDTKAPLQFLDVSNTDGAITDAALESIATVGKLRYLDVQGTRGSVSDQTMKALAQYCKELEYVHAADTAGRITQEVAKQLEQRVPGCLVTLL